MQSPSPQPLRLLSESHCSIRANNRCQCPSQSTHAHRLPHYCSTMPVECFSRPPPFTIVRTSLNEFNLHDAPPSPNCPNTRHHHVAPSGPASFLHFSPMHPSFYFLRQCACQHTAVRRLAAPGRGHRRSLLQPAPLCSHRQGLLACHLSSLPASPS